MTHSEVELVGVTTIAFDSLHTYYENVITRPKNKREVMMHSLSGIGCLSIVKICIAEYVASMLIGALLSIEEAQPVPR